MIFFSLKGQGELVDGIEDNVANAGESVSQANLNLKRALMYKATTYPLMGAALGALVGGPVGLFIGLKAGGCAAVGGGLLGKCIHLIISCFIIFFVSL